MYNKNLSNQHRRGEYIYALSALVTILIPSGNKIFPSGHNIITTGMYQNLHNSDSTF